MVDINSINEERKENKLAALWESQILEAQLRKANEAQNKNNTTTTDASGNDLSTSASKDLKATQVVNNAPSASYTASKHEQDKSLLQIAKLEQTLQKSANHIKTEQAAQAAAEAEARSARRAQAYLQAHPELKESLSDDLNAPFSTLDIIKAKNKEGGSQPQVMGNNAKHEMRTQSMQFNAHMHNQIKDELKEQANKNNEQERLRVKREDQAREQASITPNVINSANFSNHQVQNTSQNNLDNSQSLFSQNSSNQHGSNSDANSNNGNNNSNGQNNQQSHQQQNTDSSEIVNTNDVNALNNHAHEVKNNSNSSVNDERFAFVNKDEDYEVAVSNEGEILSIIDPNMDNSANDEIVIEDNQNSDLKAEVPNSIREEAIASYNHIFAQDSIVSDNSAHAHLHAQSSIANSSVAKLSSEFNPHTFLTKNDEAFLNQIADRTLRGSLSKVIADARYAGTLQGPLRAESLFTSPGILSAGSAWLSHMAAGENEQGKPFDGGILKLKAPIKSASELRDNLISLGTNMVDSLAAISKMPIDLDEENAMRVKEQIKAMTENKQDPTMVDMSSTSTQTQAQGARTLSAQSYQQERFADLARDEIKAKSLPTAESLGIFDQKRAMNNMHTWVDNTYREMMSDIKMQDKIASGGQEVRDFMEMLNISQRMSSVG